MRKHNLITIALAGAVFAGGGALAQSSTQEVNPSGSDRMAPAEKMDRQPAGTAGSTMQQTTLSQDIVGKEIVNAQGEEIGEIEAIADNKAIVSVGGFLGIGTRKVVLSPQQLAVKGQGDDAEVTTTLTREQIKVLPSYKASVDSLPGGAVSKPSGKMGGEGMPTGAPTNVDSQQNPDGTVARPSGKDGGFRPGGAVSVPSGKMGGEGMPAGFPKN